MKQLMIEHSDNTPVVLTGLQDFINNNKDSLDFDQITLITFMKLNETILLPVSQYAAKVTRIK